MTALDAITQSDFWAEATPAHNNAFTADAINHFMSSEDASEIAQVLSALLDGHNIHEGLGAQPGYDMLAEVTGFPGVAEFAQLSTLVDSGLSFFDLTTALSPPSFFAGSISHEFEALAHAATAGTGHSIFETYSAASTHHKDAQFADTPAADASDTFFFSPDLAVTSHDASGLDFDTAAQIAVLDQHHLLSANDFSII